MDDRTCQAAIERMDGMQKCSKIAQQFAVFTEQTAGATYFCTQPHTDALKHLRPLLSLFIKPLFVGDLQGTNPIRLSTAQATSVRLEEFDHLFVCNCCTNHAAHQFTDLGTVLSSRTALMNNLDHHFCAKSKSVQVSHAGNPLNGRHFSIKAPASMCARFISIVSSVISFAFATKTYLSILAHAAAPTIRRNAVSRTISIIDLVPSSEFTAHFQLEGNRGPLSPATVQVSSTINHHGRNVGPSSPYWVLRGIPGGSVRLTYPGIHWYPQLGTPVSLQSSGTGLVSVRYQLYSQRSQRKQFTCHVCRQFIKGEQMVTFLLGGYDTTPIHRTILVNAEECGKLIETKRCGPNNMV
ncbi:hypothetical protein BV898_02530 [Hypsibius exemplaris]|uniref:Uncharacterized protein n=1 Tax=Hypsibius exemplaris TaxID=2072580 RepID=A0A1W0X8G5_HYPEX|nr:hypothetical protein BV898_02530 [Hypsibius exemplaris]